MEITGWGRYPRIESQGCSFETTAELKRCLQDSESYIAYGLGRSYGDSALYKQVIFSRRYNKILDFNCETGLLTCESGVGLHEIIDAFLPRGWFLYVTPGTKYVTVGGAIASDVHGKNHHKSGCFSESVVSLDLMLTDGSTVKCDRNNNRELFLATCGGMGLTGIILTATIKLKKVESAYIRETVKSCRNLKEVFRQFSINESISYSVAWIDCLAKGEHMGRSVIMLGEHAESGEVYKNAAKKFSVPFTMPGIFLNRHSVSLFNRLYYHINPDYVEGRLTPIDKFFYPLDSIDSWNRMYGLRGFLQYQFVLPIESSYEGLSIILRKISQSGMGSFLAVLKLMGERNENYLSFPIKGYTLALDFKIEKKLFPLLDELDEIVTEFGGRLYLAKDVRMDKRTFRKGYNSWSHFAKLRDRYDSSNKLNSLQSKRLGL